MGLLVGIVCLIATEAAAQPARTASLEDRYRSLLVDYQDGRFDESVEQLIEWKAGEVSDLVERLIRERQKQIELVTERGRNALHLFSDPTARLVLAGLERFLRAVSLIHLEAAMKSGIERSAQDHFDVSVLALKNLQISADRVRGLGADAPTATTQALTKSSETTEFKRWWYVAVVSLLHRTGSFDDLQRYADIARVEFGSDPTLLVVVGAAWETLAADFSEVTAFHEVSFRGPNWKLPENLVRRHLAEIQRKARSRAVDSLTQSLSLSLGDEGRQRSEPTANEARLRLGRILLTSGDLEHAAARLEEVQMFEPTEREAFLANLFLGQVSERRGDFSDAITRYRVAADRAPHWQSAQVALSHALFRSGARKESFEQLRNPLLPAPRVLDEPWRTYFLGVPDQLDKSIGTLRSLVQQ